MTKLSRIALVAAALLLLPGCLDKPATESLKTADTLYDRILKSGTIRAAYTIYPPGCMKDANSKLVGVFVETLEKAASDLNLTVDWVEEVGWATQIEGLNTGRYDMIGSSVWANPKRARNATLSLSLYYSPLFLYTRSGEKRFDGLPLEKLDEKTVRFSTVDGGTGEVIVKAQFPRASRVALPQMSDFSQSFMDVVHNKADLVIMEPFQARKFLASNPGTIKGIDPSRALRTFGNCYMFKTGEIEFQNMLNVVLTELLSSGYVDELLSKYETYPGSYFRVARPYRMSE